MKRVAVAVALALLLIAPWPLPITSEILTVNTEGKIVDFYWKPAGILGLLGDNPWVYASVATSDGSHLERVWADIPCDGVARLSKLLDIVLPRCEDSTHAF